ncbi:hypothetical protein HFN45_15990 [Rhizobium leguminosarum]|nr:hypothetical protein [Rhizobium leguminosarum]
MHLWRRGNRFTFQQRIPISFVNLLGRTPIRVAMGAISAADAKRRAKILAGNATAWMDLGMTRKDIVNGLKAINESLQVTTTDQE